MKYRVPVSYSAGVILSYTCSAACRHCMYACSPEWGGEWISEADLDLLLKQIADFIEPAPAGPGSIGLSSGLHFTGGEPFLNFDLLCRAVEIGSEYEIPSMFVETNCSWCRDDDETLLRLAKLRDKGLSGIMISVNPFYLEYIPFERTQRCIMQSMQVFGRNTAVYQVQYYKKFTEWGITDKVPFDAYLRMEPEEDLLQNVEFFLSGRSAFSLAPRLENRFSYLVPRFPADVLSRQRCAPDFIRSWHNHFDCCGNYMPGFCGGISFGNWHDLNTLLTEGIDSGQQPVLGFLMDEDLGGLLTFARNRGYTECDEGYFSKCHLCAHVRKYLALETDEEYPELSPKKFYEML